MHPARGSGRWVHGSGQKHLGRRWPNAQAAELREIPSVSIGVVVLAALAMWALLSRVLTSDSEVNVLEAAAQVPQALLAESLDSSAKEPGKQEFLPSS